MFLCFLILLVNLVAGTPPTLTHTLTTNEFHDPGMFLWLRHPVVYAAPGTAFPIQPALALVYTYDLGPAIYDRFGRDAYRNANGAGPPGELNSFGHLHFQPSRLFRTTGTPKCTARLLGLGKEAFRLTGGTVVYMVQSICDFVDLGIDLDPDYRANLTVFNQSLSPKDDDLWLEICANANQTGSPFLIRPCNKTKLQVASCPLHVSNPIFNMSDAVTDWNSFPFLNGNENEVVFSPTVDGFSFPWEQRHAVSCEIFGAAESGVAQLLVSTIAVWKSLCQVQCPFTSRQVFQLLNSTSNSTIASAALLGGVPGFVGSLRVVIGTRSVQSTCPGSPIFSPDTSLLLQQTAQLNLCRNTSQSPLLLSRSWGGCPFVFLGSGVYAMFALALPQMRISSDTFVAQLLPGNITAQICDAAGNAVPLKSVSITNLTIGPGLPGMTVGSVQSDPESSEVKLSSCSITPLSVTQFAGPSSCGKVGQPFLLSPPQLFGWTLSSNGIYNVQTPSPFCILVVSGAVVSIAFGNEADIPNIADTALPMPVSPLIRGFDSLDNELFGPLVINATLNVSVINAQSGQNNFTIIRSHLVLLVELPAVLPGIIFPVSGRGFGLQVELSHLTTNITLSNRTAILFGNQYPVQRNITVSLCDPATVSIFGTSSVLATYNDKLVCSSLQPVALTNRILLSDEPTEIIVQGGNFQWSYRNDTWCHYSSLADPFVPDTTMGTPGAYVSSCEIRCTIAKQINPIRQRSFNFVNGTKSDGQANIQSKKQVSGNSGQYLIDGLGLFRMRQGRFDQPWSNPVAVDIVGPAFGMEVLNWETNSYKRRDTTRIQPLEIKIVDSLGSSLSGIDSQPRQIFLSSINRTTQILNASGTESVALTCSPTAGVASFSDVFFLQPQQGDYALDISASRLMGFSLLLHIEPLQIIYQHMLKLQSPVPLDYVQVSSEATENGLLPIQPHLGLFQVGGNYPDVDVSDVDILAIVQPLDEDEAKGNIGSLNARGLLLNEPVNSFGNAELILRGQVTFRTLRFSGTPGHSYRIVFRMLNSSFGVQNTSIVVAFPVCPSDRTEALTFATFVNGVNTSLKSPRGGILTKGWWFQSPRLTSSGMLADEMTADHHYKCRFGGALFPAKFIDMCTVICMARPIDMPVADAVALAPCPSNGTCCFDGEVAQCGSPVRDVLAIVPPHVDLPDIVVGNFSFVGPPTSIGVAPNRQSKRTIFRNEQVVLSSILTPLDAVIIQWFDSLGQFTSTADGLARRPVIIGGVKWVPPRLRIPANNSHLIASFGAPSLDPHATCLPDRDPEETAKMIKATIGSKVGLSTNATYSFEGLKLMKPIAGQYKITVLAFPPINESDSVPTDPNQFSNQAPEFQTEFSVHVLPGPPTRVCLWTDYEGVFVPKSIDMQPQPQLFLLDEADNIFQPARQDPLLQPYSFLNIEQAVATARLRVSLAFRPYDYRKNEGYGGWTNISLSDQSPVPDYNEKNKIGVLQFQYKNLVLSTNYSHQYILRFESPQLNDSVPVESAPIFLRPCSPSQFAEPFTSECVACPRGSESCVGGTLSNCFTCNGSIFLTLADDYWRYSPDSLTAYHCDSNRCLGGTELGSCASRYVDHSPLCAVCDAGHAHDVLGNCVQCAPTWASALVMLSYFGAAVLAVVLLVVITLKEDANPDSDHSLVLLLKIFINFFQVAGMVAEFEVNFPEFINSYFDVVSASGGNEGFTISPLECLFPHVNFLHYMMMQLFFPPVFLACMALIMILRGLYRRYCGPTQDEDGDLSNSRSLKPLFDTKVFITAALILIFLVYQTILSQMIEAFQCTNLTTGDNSPPVRVLIADPRVPCYGEEYENYLSLAIYGLFVYAVLIPMGGMSVILRCARNQGWFTANDIFSFVIRGFRLRCWFWEFVIIFRKILVRILLSTVRDATLQALLGVWGLTALFVLHAYARPFVKTTLNRAEGLSLLTLVSTLNIGLLFRSFARSSSARCGAFCSVVIVMILIFNVLVLLYFLGHIARSGFERLVELFGVDQSDGTKRFSWRNLVRETMRVLGRESSSLAPSFRTYKPKIMNKELANTLADDLEDDSDVDDDVVEAAEFEILDKEVRETFPRRNDIFEDSLDPVREFEHQYQPPEIIPVSEPSTPAAAAAPSLKTAASISPPSVARRLKQAARAVRRRVAQEDETEMTKESASDLIAAAAAVSQKGGSVEEAEALITAAVEVIEDEDDQHREHLTKTLSSRFDVA